MPESDDDDCLTLLEAHQGILAKVARTYCPRPEDRDDLIQEISLAAWRAYPRFDRRSKFSTWLYRVALNVAISFHRRERPHRDSLGGSEALDALPAPEAADGAQAEALRVLLGFIAGLDDLHKALVLLYLDDHSHQEIAEILGISASNVGTKLDRLKQRLQRGTSGAKARE